MHRVQHAAALHIARRFPEYTSSFVDAAYLRCRFLEPADLLAAAGGPADGLTAQPAPPETMATNGAEEAVAAPDDRAAGVSRFTPNHRR
jgi:hypothetical protein